MKNKKPWALSHTVTDLRIGGYIGRVLSNDNNGSLVVEWLFDNKRNKLDNRRNRICKYGPEFGSSNEGIELLSEDELMAYRILNE